MPSSAIIWLTVPAELRSKPIMRVALNPIIKALKLHSIMMAITGAPFPEAENDLDRWSWRIPAKLNVLHGRNEEP
jgi:hypothetical protein